MNETRCKTWVRVDTFELGATEADAKFLYSRTIDLSRSNRRAWLVRHAIWCAQNGMGIQVQRDWTR